MTQLGETGNGWAWKFGLANCWRCHRQMNGLKWRKHKRVCPGVSTGVTRWRHKKNDVHK